MFMRFRGGGVGHKSTREATQSFFEDRDALDSVPFTKESERTGMFYIPGSPMNEDIDSVSGDDCADTLADADMHSLSSSSEEHMDDAGSRSELDDELEEEILQSPTHELNTDLFDGDEESDEESSDDGDGSVLDDERSEFGYGDLEERLLSDDSSEDEELEGSQDELDDAILSAEDGEGAADTEDDYGDYAEY